MHFVKLKEEEYNCKNVLKKTLRRKI